MLKETTIIRQARPYFQPHIDYTYVPKDPNALLDRGELMAIGHEATIERPVGSWTTTDINDPLLEKPYLKDLASVERFKAKKFNKLTGIVDDDRLHVLSLREIVQELRDVLGDEFDANMLEGVLDQHDGGEVGAGDRDKSVPMSPISKEAKVTEEQQFYIENYILPIQDPAVRQMKLIEYVIYNDKYANDNEKYKNPNRNVKTARLADLADKMDGNRKILGYLHDCKNSGELTAEYTRELAPHIQNVSLKSFLEPAIALLKRQDWSIVARVNLYNYVVNEIQKFETVGFEDQVYNAIDEINQTVFGIQEEYFEDPEELAA